MDSLYSYSYSSVHLDTAVLAASSGRVSEAERTMRHRRLNARAPDGALHASTRAKIASLFSSRLRVWELE